MSAYLSLIGGGGGGRLFEAGRLLTFSTFRMGAYSRWALIRGWALIRINTVNLAGINKFKYEKKNEKDSGRSSKMTPSCKSPINSV